MLVFVWALEQEKRKFKQQDVYLPWKHKKIETEETQTSSYQRFYHVFVKGELRDLLSNIPHVTVIEEGMDHNNWFVLAQKQ